ncbi:hypothetical protein EV378_5083 [Pseudonocardia endophytica]|uniref:Uncharacterized protein n=1 Tax=Pseudonocardia endophytica TaxID=401976 RepID=A0A4R1HKS1_PSEEN|nr:hypothetical protein EV378_5083 [Pseudonocardia endophytica]
MNSDYGLLPGSAAVSCSGWQNDYALICDDGCGEEEREWAGHRAIR